MKRSLPLLILFLASCGPIVPIENPLSKEREAAGRAIEGNRDLKIVVFDVGQGDAALVIGPSGKTVLIDGGPPGEGMLLPAFSSLEIDHLDWIVATHYDTDHIGGLPEVIRGIDSETLVDRGDATDEENRSFSDYRETAAPYRTEADAGMQLDLGADASAQVIVVNGRYSDGRLIHLNPNEENEASIGLLIRYGDFRYFTAGDLTGGGSPGGYETKDMESIAGEIIGDIDILHVAHHGSASSTNEAFLEMTRPEAAIISVGADNDYGHPTNAVLQRLEEIGAKVYRTDRMGSLEIVTDGTTFDVHPL